MTLGLSVARIALPYLPPIAIAFAINLVLLLSLAFWIWRDASFGTLIELVQFDLGIVEDPGFNLREFHAWNQLGPRILALLIICAGAFVSGALLVWRVVAGNTRDRSIRSWLLVTSMIAFWVSLFMAREQLADAGFRWRASQIAAGTLEDAQALLAAWPEANARLPSIGEVSVVSANPKLLIVMPSTSRHPWPMTEHIEQWIYRTDEQGVAFAVGDAWIEYCPGSERPRGSGQIPLPLGAIRLHATGYTLIAPDWFLVTYKIEDTPESP